MSELNNIIKCRVCLRYDHKESNKCLSMFEIYNGCAISEKVNSIANVRIKEGDGLPDRICPDCLLQLEDAISFKQKCEASNKMLRCNVLLSHLSTVPKTHVGTSTKNIPVKEEVIEIQVAANTDEHFIEYTESEDRLANITDRIADTPDRLADIPDRLADIPDRLADISNRLENTQDRLVSTPNKPEDKHEDIPRNSEGTHIPVKKSRSIDLKLICDDCGESFKSKCKLRVHWKKIHQPEKLICPNCKRVFKSYKSMNLHLKMNNRNCHAATKVRIEGQGKSRIFHCNECSYKSKRIKDIDTHLTTHTGDRRFQCKDCLKCFTQHASLQSHRETTHKDYRIDTTCHLCGKHLQGRTKYYKHMQTHNQQGVHCKVCNKLLKSKKYLAMHMLRHSGVKSYSCEVCAASFFTYCELYNHRKKVHMKSRSFKCDQCEYKMCSVSALRKHILKHTGTNVVCLVCGQFSENAEKLAIHQKRHFDRNVQCSQCERTYHNRRSLNKHMCKHHRCTMLVEKKEDMKINYSNVKKESPPHKKEGIVILLSPPTIILK